MGEFSERIDVACSKFFKLKFIFYSFSFTLKIKRFKYTYIPVTAHYQRGSIVKQFYENLICTWQRQIFFRIRKFKVKTAGMGTLLITCPSQHPSCSAVNSTFCWVSHFTVVCLFWYGAFFQHTLRE